MTETMHAGSSYWAIITRALVMSREASGGIMSPPCKFRTRRDL
jgi:hypothetical protein